VNGACGHRRTGALGLCVVLVGALLALPGVASAATVKADFNGDGRGDLAVGAPYEEDAGSPYYEDTGAVNVLYGTASGLSASGNQFWHQNSPGILDVAEEDDRFGRALG
jgi:FG-GAP repeat